MADKDVQITGGKRSEITVVAEDKNWRVNVASELAYADRWHKDWGFLAAGALEGKSHYYQAYCCNFYRGKRTSYQNQGGKNYGARRENEANECETIYNRFLVNW